MSMGLLDEHLAAACNKTMLGGTAFAIGTTRMTCVLASVLPSCEVHTFQLLLAPI